MEDEGTADIVRDLAYPLPVTAISDLLGVPASEHDRCVELTNVVSVWFASVVRTPETARPAQAAILELVESRRKDWSGLTPGSKECLPAGSGQPARILRWRTARPYRPLFPLGAPDRD